MMDGMGIGMLWMLLWGLVGLALLVLIVVAIVWLVRQLSAGPASGPPPAEAGGGQVRRELDRRLAAGEISQEEYRALRAEIDGR
ncbi:SHOCT domain-containing protein [Spinactinospora alkalitolerans]|uniref:SHOCT domain-containing protein n=1 Tax=Spinactinospora alkalitolerans TaxID=687207 RepID=UPI0028AE5485|nr:SHOCT domain-containing protein [Spinactinospora alkalitolerans]